MKTEESIAADVAALEPVVGKTLAGWYADACKVEYGDGHALVMQACRVREAVWRFAVEFGPLADAANELLEACGRLGGDAGQVVAEAYEKVKAALWMEPGRPDLPLAEFASGDHVEKVGGDYTFVGVVVAAFPKLSGQVRYVVEDDRGVLHIYSAKNLRRVAA